MDQNIIGINAKLGRALQPLTSVRKTGNSEFPLRFMDVVWVLLAVGLAITHVTRLSLTPHLWDWPSLLVILAAAPIADLVSGFIHWTFDTWGNEGTFFIGPRLIKPFRVHHDRPNDLLKTHFFTTNADSSVAFLPFLLVPFVIPLGTMTGALIALFVTCIGIFGLPTSQIHKWSHMKKVPWLIDVLQRCRLILPRGHHDVHHTAPHTRNYCITTGWCNVVLDGVSFFPRLEHVITAVTGMKPRGVHHEAPAETAGACEK